MCAKLQGKGTDPHGPTSRIGWKKRKGGVQVGVPWEPLMLELSCFRRLWVCIGEAHIPTHMGREVILH